MADTPEAVPTVTQEDDSRPGVPTDADMRRRVIDLDDVFADEGLVSRVSACEVISSAPAPEASDHFPLLVVLSPS